MSRLTRDEFGQYCTIINRHADLGEFEYDILGELKDHDDSLRKELASLRKELAEAKQEISGMAQWLWQNAESKPEALNISFNKTQLIQLAERLKQYLRKHGEET